jgi:hypothetical protein
VVHSQSETTCSPSWKRSSDSLSLNRPISRENRARAEGAGGPHEEDPRQAWLASPATAVGRLVGLTVSSCQGGGRLL